jgi:hypothetical protein
VLHQLLGGRQLRRHQRQVEQGSLPLIQPLHADAPLLDAGRGQVSGAFCDKLTECGESILQNGRRPCFVRHAESLNQSAKK